MKPHPTLLALWAASQLAVQAQVGVGTTTPDASAQLDISSTTLGLLPPRMTQDQREAIDTPAAGLLVYQTNGTIPGLYIHDGTSWSTFSGKESALSFSSPFSRSGDTITLATAGAATAGALTSADWSTFNNKVAATRGIATTAPLTGGGDLSADLTLAIAQATASADGYLSSTDWSTFNAKESALTFSAPFSRSDNTITLATASATTAGALSSADWTTLNAKENALSFSAPFSRSDNAISLAAASVSTNGYLSGTDWTTFNAKLGGSGTTGYVPKFTASGTVGNSAIVSDATGKVGIGTSSPSHQLTIAGPSAATGTGVLQLTTPGAAQGETSSLSLYSTFQGAEDDIPRRTADLIAGFNGGSWGSEYLALGVGSTGAINDLGNVTSEKLRIQGNGNVGIGTTTPAYKLDVAGTINASAITIGDYPVATSKDTYWSTAGSGAIQYSGGNVGIGTATPAYTLDVCGDLNVAGSILIDGVPLSGTGTVTSIAGSGGSTGLTVTGGPVTTAGTLTLGGTLALTNGGTGATTAAAARTALGLGTAATLAATNANTASTVVGRDASGNFAAGTITASLTGTASKATNLVGGNSTTLYGAMPYQSGIDATTWVSPNTSTTKKFLRMTGSGTNGAIPAWDTLVAADIPTLNQNSTGTAANVTGTVAVANGGTGLTGYAVGDLPYASAATTLSRLTAGATGNALISGGATTAPSWGKIGLTTHVSGILPVANGGTGTATGSITGTGALYLTAGGTNQSVSVAPSGTGYSYLGGNVAIGGTAAAANKLNIVDTSTTVTKGLNIAKSGAVSGNAYAAYLTASGATDWSVGALALASGTGTYNVGVQGQASGASTSSNFGVYTTASGGSAQNIGILGSASGSTGTSSYGGYFENSATITSAKYGVFARAVGNSTGANYGGYFSATNTGASYALVTDAGNVGIGTLTPTSKLVVAGDVNITGSYLVNGTAIGSGTVTSVSGTAPISVTTGTTTPVVALTGTVPVANGGTGATTLTGYIKGSGTAAMTASATIPGSVISGNITGSAANVTGTVAVANGGTGAATLTGLLRGTGTTAVTGASTVALASEVTGALPVANGGTGTATAPTRYGLIYASTTTGYASTAAGTSGQFLKSNGTGAPTWATLSGAASGANSDITSLSGLTTALSVGQGGTGQTSLPAGYVLIGNGTGGISYDSWLTYDRTNFRLGIGTSAPGYPLTVPYGVDRATGTAIYYYIYAGGNALPAATNRTLSTSAYFGQGVAVGGSVVVHSDARIKDVIAVSDAEADLATLQQVKITDYTYIDRANKGNRPKKGVIAQELEQVYSNAVSLSSDFVPNVYALAETVVFNAQAEELTLTVAKPHGLAAGDVVRVYTDSKPIERTAARVVDANTFVLAGVTEATEKVFVFGKQVNDFRTVDYDQVAMLNVSATQALAKRCVALEADNDALKTDNEAIKADNEAIKAQNAAILKRLDALEAK